MTPKNTSIAICFPMLSMFFIDTRLWQRIYHQWLASSVSKGYLHKIRFA